MVFSVKMALTSVSHVYSILTDLAVSFFPLEYSDSHWIDAFGVNPYDGRVVSNFIVQALKGEDMTVYGDGRQTRSFQYIHDLIDGMIALMNSNETRPVNIGNGEEFSIGEFAKLVRDIVEKVQEEDGVKLDKRVKIIYKPIPTDDPQKRRPDTSRAKESLEWQPCWSVHMGLEEMVRYYKAKMAEGSLQENFLFTFQFVCVILVLVHRVTFEQDCTIDCSNTFLSVTLAAGCRFQSKRGQKVPKKIAKNHLKIYIYYY